MVEKDILLGSVLVRLSLAQSEGLIVIMEVRSKVRSQFCCEGFVEGIL